MEEFQEIVWDYYTKHKRELPWREEPFDQYYILVSEIMLQQTQASRVVPKYNSFLKQFPTVASLARAPLSDILREWSGLGYNRRAKYLHEAAKQLVSKVGPWKQEDLEACKGIGKNTAAAVLVYSYNQPLVFIETNIRTVYIHHFLPDRDDVTDAEILELLEKTLPIDQEEQPETWAMPKPGAMRNPPGVSHYREWYYALMDYGVFLKKSVGNISRQSKHYAKQSRFAGSLRQVRGEVLRQLQIDSRTMPELEEIIPDERLSQVIDSLEKDALIKIQKGRYSLG